MISVGVWAEEILPPALSFVLLSVQIDPEAHRHNPKRILVFH